MARIHRPNLAQLKRFARLLGWHNLREFRYRFPPEVSGQPRVMRWFEAGVKRELWLQINIYGVPHVAVYAIRYRLLAGWHLLAITRADSSIEREADRLHKWLHRSWFDTPKRRTEFRRLHPECTGYGWAKVRNAGAPYRCTAIPCTDCAPLVKGGRKLNRA
jgi:hypothetical protein